MSLIVNKKSNIVGDNASDDKQKNTITHEEEIFKLKEQCTAYKYNIDDMSKLNKKLQNEIDDQKVELELNVELEEKMNALHREYSVLQKKYQRKVEDYDGMKRLREGVWKCLPNTIYVIICATATISQGINIGLLYKLQLFCSEI